MKQKIYVLGLATMLVTIAGTVSKVNHWPGAQIMLILGLGSMAVWFIPAALLSHYRALDNRDNISLYLATAITFFAVFAGMLYKINHWPYAGIVLLITMPIPYLVFLPVFLIVISRKKNFNIYNLVFVLLLLAFSSVFSGLLSLSVSRTRIEDSYNILRSYGNVEEALRQINVKDDLAPVSLKIDEVIKVADEFKGLMLRSQNITAEEWRKQPGNLFKPDVASIAGRALEKTEGLPLGGRMEKAINSLQAVIAGNNQKELLITTQKILECKYPPEPESGWAYFNFIDNFLPWSLVYLDEVGTNLNYISWTIQPGQKVK